MGISVNRPEKGDKVMCFGDEEKREM